MRLLLEQSTFRWDGAYQQKNTWSKVGTDEQFRSYCRAAITPNKGFWETTATLSEYGEVPLRNKKLHRLFSCLTEGVKLKGALSQGTKR